MQCMYVIVARPVVVFITLGTARVHQLRSTGEVVANCHKRESILCVRTYVCTYVCMYVLYVYMYV